MTDPRSPDSQTLYVVGALDSRVAAIRLVPGRSPVHLPGSPYPLERSGSFSVVISPDHRRLYCAHLTSGHIDILEVGSDGTLRPTPESPVQTGSPAGGLVIDPGGRYLFATCIAFNSDLAAVRSFRVTPDGLESAGPPVRTGGLLRDCIALPALTPDGRNLYVASYLGNRVLHFRIGSDGALSEVQQRLRCGRGPVSPVVSPDGRHLYVVNEFSASVSGYAISAQGGLTPIAGSPFGTGRFPHGITIAPDGRFAYVPNLFGGSVSGYLVAPDGALKELDASPFPTMSHRSLPGRAICSDDGRTLYLVELGSATRAPRAEVHCYDILPDGGLQPTEHNRLDTGILFADGPGSLISLSPASTAGQPSWCEPSCPG